MPTFRIHVRNADFTASDEHDFENLAAAKFEAAKGALYIGADEVAGGKPYFGAEISIESDGQPPERFVVSVGMSPIL